MDATTNISSIHAKKWTEWKIEKNGIPSLFVLRSSCAGFLSYLIASRRAPSPQRALDTVGFTSDEQLNLFKIIAAILHLGNVTVGGTDQAHIRDPSQLERICHLLGIDNSSDLLNALVRPKVKAGREWVVQARTSRQVIDELAALSKALYEKNFGAIVDRINKALGRPSTKTFIGVLDIAGFEIFETNGTFLATFIIQRSY